MLHKKGGKNMKKRFTVMLEENTIKMIKNLQYSPTALRQLIEETLETMVINEEGEKLEPSKYTIEQYRQMMRTGRLPDDK